MTTISATDSTPLPRRTDLRLSDTGVIEAIPIEGRPTHEWSICVFGDWSPDSQQVDALRAANRDFYGSLIDRLRNCDLRIFNLETVLCGDGLAPSMKDGVCLRVSSSLAKELAVVGMDVACLANNHSLDFGAEGLRSTQAALSGAGVGFLGAGCNEAEASQPLVREIRGVKVAIVNCAEGEEARAGDLQPGVASLDETQLQATFAICRGLAEVIVVIVHAGREYLPVPAPHIQHTYRRLIDWGATVVIGHHPHVPQGVERWKQGLIVYSLGNFVMRMTDTRLTQVGYGVRLDFYGAQLRRCELLPFSIRAGGLDLLHGVQKLQFIHELRELSTIASSDELCGEIWAAYADRWWSHHGHDELVDAAVRLSNPRHVWRAMIGGWLQDGGRRPILDSILWRLYHQLSRRSSPRDQQDAAPSPGELRGAAILRNRFDTVTHRELYLTALGRMMDGRAGNSLEPLKRRVAEWLLP